MKNIGFIWVREKHEVTPDVEIFNICIDAVSQALPT